PSLTLFICSRLSPIYPLLPSLSLFIFTATATTEIYTLSLHDALPISFRLRLEQIRQTRAGRAGLGQHRLSMLPWNSAQGRVMKKDRKSTRLNSRHVKISYAVFCLKKKKKNKKKKINDIKKKGSGNLVQ